jgi:hypothetical protein
MNQSASIFVLIGQSLQPGNVTERQILFTSPDVLDEPISVNLCSYWSIPAAW